MTFAQRYARPPTIERPTGRAGPPPRIQDMESANRRDAETLRFAAPTGGLMLNVDVANIPEGGAALMDNWFPETDAVRAFGGSQQRNTGLGGEVLALLGYEAGSTRKAFGVTATSIFDVTNAGAVGAAVVSGLAASVWSAINFTSSGGTFLIACSAGNGVRRFDGAAWTSSAITGSGLTAANLSQVSSYANRLFFAESGTSNAWYLPVDSIAGAAIKFPLGGEFQSGGNIIATGTWSSDAGDNPRSMWVAVSTNGDVVVYEGPDPATWSKRGNYKIAPPLGPNCMFRAGGDLAIMTESGLFAMSQVVDLDAAILMRRAVSVNVGPLWRSLVKISTPARWQMIRRDADSMAVVIPVLSGAGAFVSLASNMETGAWCTRTGWNPTCGLQFGEEFLIGTPNGRIMRADYGGFDDGGPYVCALIGRFEVRDTRVINARMARAVVRSFEECAPRVSAVFDYDTSLPPPPAACIPSVGRLWDVADWDVDVWDGEERPRGVWQAINGRGAAIAPVVMYTFGQPDTPRSRLVRVDMTARIGEVIA